MENEEKKGGLQDPAQTDSGAQRPQREGQQEGDYRNVETSVNNPDYFGDDYESQQEDELTMEEPKTEKAGTEKVNEACSDIARYLFCRS